MVVVLFETRLRPDTFYGVAKARAETLMSLYADRHGLDVVSCRIGSFRAEPATARNLATWLSHGDCVRMVEAALTTPGPGFAVLYGISHNTRGWWDLAPGRALVASATSSSSSSGTPTSRRRSKPPRRASSSTRPIGSSVPIASPKRAISAPATGSLKRSA